MWCVCWHGCGGLCDPVPVVPTRVEPAAKSAYGSVQLSSPTSKAVRENVPSMLQTTEYSGDSDGIAHQFALL
jgi:hypothetical protein